MSEKKTNLMKSKLYALYQRNNGGNLTSNCVGLVSNFKVANACSTDPKIRRYTYSILSLDTFYHNMVEYLRAL